MFNQEPIRDAAKFRQNVYDVFDSPARTAVRNWIDKQGLYTLSVEDYGADLKAAKIVDGKDGNPVVTITRHELEVRSIWNSEERFPYETITIPHRKSKLFGIGQTDLFFWTISGDYKKALFVSGANVIKCPVIEKMTSRGLDKFFEVHIGYYKLVSLV